MTIHHLAGCHLTAFIAGFVLDLILGDPPRIPHPVRMMGWLIARLENVLYKDRHLVCRGCVLAALVITATAAGSIVILAGAYGLDPVVGILAESIMTWQILALRGLRVESMKVYDRLENGNLQEARKAVSMIVGRDTEELDRTGVIKAAVETVAENTSDGVIAPLLYLAAGGPVFGFVYKAVNTMDSMIGYKNERYLFFGRAAAKLDDAVNYVPARISAWLMIAAAFCLGKEFDGREACRIYRRDRKNHASPNSAQTESVLAGALGIRLAGSASYFGRKVEKPYIGDEKRAIEAEDIRRANRILYLAAEMCWMVCVFLLAFWYSR